MFIVIFEVQPKKGHFDQYLDIAKHLKPELQQIEGFVDNERFRSQKTEGKILSLSTWRDEKAIVRWRTLKVHHEAQEKGREEVFSNYHLRVGKVIKDSSTATANRKLVVEHANSTEVGEAKVVTVCELTPEVAKTVSPVDATSLLPNDHAESLTYELFTSITTPGKMVVILNWKDEQAAAAWQPKSPPRCSLRYRHVNVIRDYGMFDRREAPQYYPEV